MTITSSRRGHVVVLTPEGNLMGGPDATQLNTQIRELAEKGDTRVVVDLSSVSFMNSSGLGILIGAAGLLRSAGGALRLARASEKIRALITITKLGPVLETFPTVEDAVNSLPQ